jgi:hypothetical protein
MLLPQLRGALYLMVVTEAAWLPMVGPPPPNYAHQALVPTTFKMTDWSGDPHNAWADHDGQHHHGLVESRFHLSYECIKG